MFSRRIPSALSCDGAIQYSPYFFCIALTPCGVPSAPSASCIRVRVMVRVRVLTLTLTLG